MATYVMENSRYRGVNKTASRDSYLSNFNTRKSGTYEPSEADTESEWQGGSVQDKADFIPTQKPDKIHLHSISTASSSISSDPNRLSNNGENAVIRRKSPLGKRDSNYSKAVFQNGNSLPKPSFLNISNIPDDESGNAGSERSLKSGYRSAGSTTRSSHRSEAERSTMAKSKPTTTISTTSSSAAQQVPKSHGIKLAATNYAIHDKTSGHERKSNKFIRPPPPQRRQNIDFEISFASSFASDINVNERIANSKLAKHVGGSSSTVMESTESISPSDIFFSRGDLTPKVQRPSSIPSVSIRTKNSSCDIQSSISSAGIVSSLTYPTASSALSTSGISKSGILGGGKSFNSSNESKRCNTGFLFACIRGGACLPVNPPILRDDSFVSDKFSVRDTTERLLWADKHRPGSLAGFLCHKQQAQLLKQLISQGNCPHILFIGPSGSGKKALASALLREIYGAGAWKVSYELRSFEVQGQKSGFVSLPVASSNHHVEINLLPVAESARYVLMALIKELTRNSELALLEENESSFAADYKVMVVYEVDRLSMDVQHLIKWIMERYTDACKLILCCENDANLVESIKNRCQVINVDAPVTHEIMEVLLHIAKKESFELPMSFAASIASRSKQNLRRAIVSLEACKANQYPFKEDQPIPFGWEEVVIEIATDIVTDPTPRRLFLVRGKLQGLLAVRVHPKLILQSLGEELIQRIDTLMKKEISYWHVYYEKRLSNGTNVLVKLEEFVAKFMSVYRKQLKDHSMP